MHSKQLSRCRHEREDGTQCKAHPQTSKQYCFFHDPALKKERKAAQRAGGMARFSKPVKAPIAPKSLKTPSDVVELVNETIDQLLCGQLDPESCYTIGLLSSLLLDAMRKSSPERRFAPGQAIVGEQAPFAGPRALLLPDAETEPPL